jgi:superfamily II DNA or RNA helicase
LSYKLYDYQKRIIKAQKTFIKGKIDFRAQIYAGTGAGKTVCFNTLIANELAKNPNLRVLVAHPRIALSDDQQYRTLMDLGYATEVNGKLQMIDNPNLLEITNFHSSSVKNHPMGLGRKCQNTTNPEALEEIRETTPGAHMTFTTYHSLGGIADLDYDLVICDEAHYLVNTQFRESLHKFRPDVKVLFYTATPIYVAASDECMSNLDLFGKVIATVPPKEAIKAGRVVPPKMLFINCERQKEGNTIDDVNIIGISMREQLAEAKVDNPGVVHKMLVAMSTTMRFTDIRDRIADIRNICDNSHIDIYTVSADAVIKNHGGKDSAWYGSNRRKDGLDDFKSNTNPCVIVHCDTIAEGIDISGISGELILRDVKMSKAMQTIGRGSRTAPGKTFNYVCIVTVDGIHLAGQDLAWFTQLFREFGYNDIVEELQHKLEEGFGAEIDEFLGKDDAELDEYKTIETSFEDILSDFGVKL